MKQADMAWFQLRFPHDLSRDAVLAALSAFSGVSYNTRLVFDLSAKTRESPTAWPSAQEPRHCWQSAGGHP